MLIRHKFLITAIALISGGCSLWQTPPPKQLNYNLAQIPNGTIIDGIALMPMDVPNPSQTSVANSLAVRVANAVRGYPNTVELIPQNAIITGVYLNDGKSCHIAWQAAYANYRAVELNSAALNLAAIAQNTSCDPRLGIAAGQLLKIKLNSANHQ